MANLVYFYDAYLFAAIFDKSLFAIMTSVKCVTRDDVDEYLLSVVKGHNHFLTVGEKIQLKVLCAMKSCFVITIYDKTWSVFQNNYTQFSTKRN